MLDFLSSIMTPLHAVISAVLTFAYRFWAMIFGEGSGAAWAVSIMTLTIIIRTILIPLFIRQINSTRNMQLIQPKMKELQEKYGADRQRLGIETQKLMKAEGVSPTASCVPLLLQMPIFFALYQVLYSIATSPEKPRGYFFQQNLELAQSFNESVFLGADLAGRFFVQGQPFSFGPTQIMAIVLVIAMAGLLFLTQRQLMTKNMAADALTGPMAQQQKLMLYLFPAMYLFMGAMIPVGVLVYWVTNNLWTMVQQYLLIRNNPTPGTPAFIDWEERMIKQGKDPQAIAEARRLKRQRKRSTNTTTNTSRQVGGARPTGTTGESGASTPEAGGVQRQQIQRQQPNRQSRSGRTVKKKDGGSASTGPETKN
jgi:YidC/Oxa1 family membrane protein insertase